MSLFSSHFLIIIIIIIYTYLCRIAALFLGEGHLIVKSGTRVGRLNATLAWGEGGEQEFEHTNHQQFKGGGDLNLKLLPHSCLIKRTS